ncbi:winged helix-turn-helix transcriptional regulator [Arthrobacter sp. SF27]|nr:winged helix-turn-helix transcriptional regulator [Arthrobacter sp. SF27]
MWKKVSADLMEEIHNGVFASGFPGEVELAKRYGVSRGTIRAALRPLREAGHITAQPGRRPAVVAGSSTAYGPIYSILASIQESGMNHSRPWSSAHSRASRRDSSLPHKPKRNIRGCACRRKSIGLPREDRPVQTRITGTDPYRRFVYRNISSGRRLTRWGGHSPEPTPPPLKRCPGRQQAGWLAADSVTTPQVS